VERGEATAMVLKSVQQPAKTLRGHITVHMRCRKKLSWVAGRLKGEKKGPRGSGWRVIGKCAVMNGESEHCLAMRGEGALPTC